MLEESGGVGLDHVTSDCESKAYSLRTVPQLMAEADNAGREDARSIPGTGVAEREQRCVDDILAIPERYPMIKRYS